MNPQQRLELLKDIGGTKVYEERRKESIKVMNETDSKKAQVRQQLQPIPCSAAGAFCDRLMSSSFFVQWVVVSVIAGGQTLTVSSDGLL